MALAVTESWIRDRVRLNHNNLGKYHKPSPEDVRSLSLPGTYHEKISSLGESIRNFTRLKSLDLSRNAIESLQGLENLKMLEKLTLYYNNVPSLQELYRLRYNQRLQELDLRLNPVARNEPDYRLFLIHMLPNLRRLVTFNVAINKSICGVTEYSHHNSDDITSHLNFDLDSISPYKCS
ncbi:hypothetical protein LSH36_531g01064 [Paralvinella palmiformis]|uniref:Uncharacterized protein n=1 Tax=Paralvinella palmiformis TaxID=53620 RepID=A0AAD9J7F3_9ANNE|nr:hypothetical protein LSH36_531g01064 [Paralvinella palmiformis]